MNKPDLTDKQKKCMACRECCEYVEVPYTMFNYDTMEYFLNRGTQFWIATNGAVQVRFHEPCVHISEAGCDMYEDRPTTCRTYMCNVGDKSIREINDEECAKAADLIRDKILQHRENSKK